jgi:hypothetical protein
MRETRHITVAVSADLYRQTRHLAAEYDSTVTAIVAYLLENLPRALKGSKYPVGGPKPIAPAKPAAPTPVASEPATSVQQSALEIVGTSYANLPQSSGAPQSAQ